MAVAMQLAVMLAGMLQSGFTAKCTQRVMFDEMHT
jgi:hypothetical protein